MPSPLHRRPNPLAVLASYSLTFQEVRRILADVRAQYDQVHLEAERREARMFSHIQGNGTTAWARCGPHRLKSPSFESRFVWQIEVTVPPTSPPRRRKGSNHQSNPTNCTTWSFRQFAVFEDSWHAVEKQLIDTLRAQPLGPQATVITMCEAGYCKSWQSVLDTTCAWQCLPRRFLRPRHPRRSTITCARGAHGACEPLTLHQSDTLEVEVSERITKEQSLLKEKLLLMEAEERFFAEVLTAHLSSDQAHLERKTAESQRKARRRVTGSECRTVRNSETHQVAVQERLVRKGAQCSQDCTRCLNSLCCSREMFAYVCISHFEDLDILEQDVEHERVVRSLQLLPSAFKIPEFHSTNLQKVRDEALAKMNSCLQALAIVSALRDVESSDRNAEEMQAKIEAKERRAKFEFWRHEVGIERSFAVVSSCNATTQLCRSH